MSPLPHAAAKTCDSGALRRRVRELLNEPWDVVVLDGLQSTWATPLLASRHPDSTAVYISQNHETSLRSEVAAAERSLPRRAVLRYDVWRLRRLEAMTVDACDIVSAITDRDLDLFAAESSDTSFVVVPPGWSGTSPLRSAAQCGSAPSGGHHGELRLACEAGGATTVPGGGGSGVRSRRM